MPTDSEASDPSGREERERNPTKSERGREKVRE
jgi:hypothetical protein